jgi:hypothetical protein
LHPLVHLDPGAGFARLQAALLEVFAALAPAHPAGAIALGADGRWQLPVAGLRLDPTDLSIHALHAEADARLRRLRTLPAPAGALAALSLTLQEDLVLMGWPGPGPTGDAASPDAEQGLVALAASVVSPSGWDPGERIGQPLQAIHGPVADGERLRLASTALSRAMVDKGPFVRYIWTLAPDGAMARWPGAAASPPAGGGSLDDLWFRCERQVTLPLPRVGASLFLIRVFMAPLTEVAADAERRARLVASLASMSDAVIAYKGLGALRERVLRAWGGLA